MPPQLLNGDRSNRETTTREVPPLDPPRQADDVPAAIDRLLTTALAAHASDVHLVPTQGGLEIAWRRNGVLSPLVEWPTTFATNLVARLKFLADLLTYRTELPQEGRIHLDRCRVETPHPTAAEVRLSTFPTIHGEKAVLRFYVGSGTYRTLDDLEMAEDVAQAFRHALRQTAGVLLITGPAGSGKTTTAYAALRALRAADAGTRSLVSLEDPVEAVLEGVAQTQVHRPAEFTYPLGLRSLLRQDPDVIFVGEIRDAITAATVFQAGLTGHLVLTTFHAGSAAEAAVRLLEFGVEPHVLRAGLQGILCQRLLRTLCPCTADSALSLPAARVDCPACWGTGYDRRTMIAEWFSPAGLTDSSLWTRTDLAAWQAAAEAHGLRPLAARARELITTGRTTTVEVARVLGTTE